MKINRDNYEVFFIDYLDGKLNDSQIVEMEVFLMENEDLKHELKGLEKIQLTEDSVVYKSKENLKQIDFSNPICNENFDFYCIAELEGDLTEVQSRELKTYLSENPAKVAEWELHKKSFPVPTELVEFSDKSSLKKKAFIIPSRVLYYSVSIAASIALLIFVYVSFNTKNFEQIFTAEEIKLTESADTTSVDTKKTETDQTVPKSKTEEKLRIGTKALRNQAAIITIKVNIPIASVENSKKTSQIKDSKIKDPIAKVDNRLLKKVSLMTSVPKESLDADKILATIEMHNANANANANEFITLDEFAKQKFTQIAFKEKEKESGIWGIASVGIEKISDLTGAEMEMTAKLNENGKTKNLSFNSKLLSFSTTINKEN